MKNKMINVIVILIISVCMLMIGAKAATTILSSTVTYKDTTVEAALDELISKTYQCPNGSVYLCNKDIKIGDYITSLSCNYSFAYTSYTIPSSLTGYDTDQTLNPSELNKGLWRVINVNYDGTVDIVSEYASSTEVYFKGATGYQNLVGTLNLIASQYMTCGTIRTRHMGYNGQVSVLKSDHIYSSLGNDTYSDDKDIELVTNAIGTLDAYKAGTTTKANYWLSSRNYQNNYLVVCFVNNGESKCITTLGTSTSPDATSFSIRPIITLSATSNIVSGDGTKAHPWQLD